jgi:hypothetical protein
MGKTSEISCRRTDRFGGNCTRHRRDDEMLATLYNIRKKKQANKKCIKTKWLNNKILQIGINYKKNETRNSLLE